MSPAYTLSFPAAHVSVDPEREARLGFGLGLTLQFFFAFAAAAAAAAIPSGDAAYAAAFSFATFAAAAAFSSATFAISFASFFIVSASGCGGPPRQFCGCDPSEHLRTVLEGVQYTMRFVPSSFMAMFSPGGHFLYVLSGDAGARSGRRWVRACGGGQ